MTEPTTLLVGNMYLGHLWSVFQWLYCLTKTESNFFSLLFEFFYHCSASHYRFCVFICLESLLGVDLMFSYIDLQKPVGIIALLDEAWYN